MCVCECCVCTKINHFILTFKHKHTQHTLCIIALELTVLMRLMKILFSFVSFLTC